MNMPTNKSMIIMPKTRLMNMTLAILIQLMLASAAASAASAASAARQIATTSNTDVKDFCETESFDAACGDDDVILMTSARYGRMRIGSCVKKDLGYIGCSTDVLGILDSRCSGRQTCTVRIPDPDLDKTRPCLEELKTYLEASYQCVRVEKPVGKCGDSEVISSRRSWSITRSTRSGYISGSVSQDTGCATELYPLRINGWPGQKINITVYDFNYHGVMSSLTSSINLPSSAASRGTSIAPSVSFSSDQSQPQGQGQTDCRQYLVIVDLETQRKVKVCPGPVRYHQVLVSTNRSVELFFNKVGQNDDDDDQRMLVQFTVIGCGVDSRPLDSSMLWLSRDVTEAVIGCRNTDQKWRLSCIQNRWEGEVGNCTRKAAAPLGVTLKTSDNESTMTHGAAIIIVLCVAFLMGILILGLGALGILIRRCRIRNLKRSVGTKLNSRASCDILATTPSEPPQTAIFEYGVFCPTTYTTSGLLHPIYSPTGSTTRLPPEILSTTAVDLDFLDHCYRYNDERHNCACCVASDCCPHEITETSMTSHNPYMSLHRNRSPVGEVPAVRDEVSESLARCALESGCCGSCSPAEEAAYAGRRSFKLPRPRSRSGGGGRVGESGGGCGVTSGGGGGGEGGGRGKGGRGLGRERYGGEGKVEFSPFFISSNGQLPSLGLRSVASTESDRNTDDLEELRRMHHGHDIKLNDDLRREVNQKTGSSNIRVETSRAVPMSRDFTLVRSHNGNQVLCSDCSVCGE